MTDLQRIEEKDVWIKVGKISSGLVYHNKKGQLGLSPEFHMIRPLTQQELDEWNARQGGQGERTP